MFLNVRFIRGFQVVFYSTENKLQRYGFVEKMFTLLSQ